MLPIADGAMKRINDIETAQAAWTRLALTLALACGSFACGESSDAPSGSHAKAATMPAPVTALASEVVADAAPEITVLDLEPVDGLPEAQAMGSPS